MKTDKPIKTRWIIWAVLTLLILLVFGLYKARAGWMTIAPPETPLPAIDSCPIIEQEIIDPFVRVVFDCDTDGEGDRECLYFFSEKGVRPINCVDLNK